jgi:hypothetical protein
MTTGKSRCAPIVMIGFRRNAGDGSVPVTQRAPTESPAYTSAATHLASMTVTDSEGGTASATVRVHAELHGGYL